jgi:outer membrane protein OmpA-like peptidoglycan-associated protein
MRQFLSFFVVAVVVLTLSACATPYVKDISDVKMTAVVEEAKAEVVATPAAKVVEVPDVTVINTKVLFDFDSYDLDTDAKITLDKIATQMELHPDTLLVLKGHTDKYGSDEYNQILSENRADSVEDYLVQAGVSADRIVSVVGFGKTQLIPDVTHRENRRVIILSVDG